MIKGLCNSNMLNNRQIYAMKVDNLILSCIKSIMDAKQQTLPF